MKVSSIHFWIYACVAATMVVKSCVVAELMEHDEEEELSPIQRAIRAVDKEAYKMVKLEQLYYDPQSQQEFEAAARVLEQQFAASKDITEEEDPNIKVPVHQRKLWHTDPVAPASVCAYSMNPGRRLFQNKDSMNLGMDEEGEEYGLDHPPVDIEYASDSHHKEDDSMVAVEETKDAQRALQTTSTTTCTKTGWKYNSCCGGCGPSFTTWADLNKAVSDYANKVNTTDMGHINCWDTSSVTTMQSMFYCSTTWCNVAFTKFNSDISCWNVSKVTSFKQMFYLASSFNQDLSRWTMSSAKDVTQMFGNAKVYNRNLCKWYCTLPSTVSKSGMFGSTACTSNSVSFSSRSYMCQKCTTIQCPPVKPSKPSQPFKPKAAPVKPAPKAPSKPSQPITPPVQPFQPKAAPLAVAPTGAPVIPTVAPVAAPQKPAPAKPTGKPVTAKPVTAAPVNSYYGNSPSPQPASMTAGGTISKPVTTTSKPVTAQPVMSKPVKITSSPTRTYSDVSTAFDGTTTKWKAVPEWNLYPFCVVEVNMCEHVKAVAGFRIYTANDHPEYDPTYYEYLGYIYASGKWVTISSGSLTLPNARNPPGMPLIGANYYEVRYLCNGITCSVYDKYLLKFRADNNLSKIVQIGEIVFLYTPPTPPPTMAPVTQSPTMRPTTKNPTKAPTSSPTVTPKWTCPAPKSAPLVCDNGLTAGDVVVTAFNTDDGTGTQTVVLLTPAKKLYAGDSFFMTDRPLKCDSNCNCDFLPLTETYMDGTVQFTAPNDITGGQTIAYSQFKKPFSPKDVYFAFGKGQYCYYADAWTQVTWTSQSSTSQFHLYSYDRDMDMTPYDILSGDNIFLYCMAGNQKVFLFGLMLSDEISQEQGWTPYNRDLHSDFHKNVNPTFKIASKKSHMAPNTPSLLLSPLTVPPPKGVMCQCSPPLEPSFLGCFKDGPDRALPVFMGAYKSKADCISACRMSGYHFAGRQWTEECWCGGLDKSLSDYEDLSYAKWGPSTGCACDSPNIGGWLSCVYKLPPLGDNFTNNFFQCDDGYAGWCKESNDCLSPFNKGLWDDGCGVQGVAKKWQYRNNWRLATPPYTDCKVTTAEALVNWVTDARKWNYTQHDFDYPSISSQVVTSGFNFLCTPPPDKTDEVVTEMKQQAAVQLHEEEMVQVQTQIAFNKAVNILKAVEVKQAITQCKTEKSMFMPDGVTPIKGNESPNTQVTDPRLPKCFGKGALCLEPGAVNSRARPQLSASAEQEAALNKFGSGKVLSTSPDGVSLVSSGTQTSLGTV